uniref:(northern house mosquito) hypothetical protein n=1 Tax=Culex pipiens TaxID=7175 RepID=A0A8D8DY95_CULPI
MQKKLINAHVVRFVKLYRKPPFPKIIVNRIRCFFSHAIPLMSSSQISNSFWSTSGRGSADSSRCGRFRSEPSSKSNCYHHHRRGNRVMLSSQLGSAERIFFNGRFGGLKWPEKESLLYSWRLSFSKYRRNTSAAITAVVATALKEQTERRMIRTPGG